MAFVQAQHRPHCKVTEVSHSVALCCGYIFLSLFFLSQRNRRRNCFAFFFFCLKPMAFLCSCSGQANLLVVSGATALMSGVTAVEVVNRTGESLKRWTIEQAQDIDTEDGVTGKVFGSWQPPPSSRRPHVVVHGATFQIIAEPNFEEIESEYVWASTSTSQN